MSSGSQYCNLITAYLLHNYEKRGIKVYQEVNLGKTIIGKNRRIDILLVTDDNQAFAIECKFQDVKGTTDEKLPYAMQNIESLPIPGCIVYAGNGFSPGVQHMLQSSEIAAHCLPDKENLKPGTATRELDHLLAMNLKWWDVAIGNKKPINLSDIKL
ncbi:MAG: hypothetical protein HQK83_13590 [Fibrobacteria bacterium]|nr:hypothetical protein [Fibrobacteria bacterium]